MTRNGFAKTILFFLLTASSSLAADDVVEFEVHSESRPVGGLVTLGDVVRIHGANSVDRQRWERIALMPLPASGQARWLDAQEIRDWIALQDQAPQRFRMRGATRVRIHGGRNATAVDAGFRQPSFTDGTPSRPVTGKERLAQRSLQQAIADYLRKAVDPDIAWEVHVAADQLSDLPRLLSQQLEVGGGQAPWTGRQEFQIAMGRELRSVRIVAEVTTPSAIVVARRPIRRGMVIRLADVELRPATRAGSDESYFHSLDDVQGMQATRTLSPGRPLEQGSIRQPILVSRREIVTVVARSGGLVVRTDARCLDEGGAGDLVQMEKLDRSEKFTAYVTGPRTVEVLVEGSRVALQPRDSTLATRAAGSESSSAGRRTGATGTDRVRYLPRSTR